MVTWRSPILSNPHDTEDRLDIVERCAKQVQQMAKAEKKWRTDTLQQPQNDPNWQLAAGIGSTPILWDIEVKMICPKKSDGFTIQKDIGCLLVYTSKM